MNPETPDEVAWQQRHYESRVETLLDDLRRMVDRIERAAKPYDGSMPFSRDGRWLIAAEAVQHELTWSIANVGAYRLVRDAAAVDKAEAEARP